MRPILLLRFFTLVVCSLRRALENEDLSLFPKVIGLCTSQMCYPHNVGLRALDLCWGLFDNNCDAFNVADLLCLLIHRCFLLKAFQEAGKFSKKSALNWFVELYGSSEHHPFCDRLEFALQTFRCCWLFCQKRGSPTDDIQDPVTTTTAVSLLL